MAHSSNTTNLTLDQSQQADADASPAPLDIHSVLHQPPTNADTMTISGEPELAHDQSKRAVEDTSPASVQGANVQKYESPAIAAVLQTNELLHLIIAEVPREHRTSIRRVSKSWKLAVEKIGYAFDPLKHALSDVFACRDPLSPLHPCHMGFRFHPALTEGEHHPTWIYIDRGGEKKLHYGIFWTMNRIDFSRWAGLEREFVVSPPVTELVSWSKEFRQAMTQVLGGIRFEDLMDHINKVEGSPRIDLFFATPDPRSYDTEPESGTSESEDEEGSDAGGESDEVACSKEEDAEDGASRSSDPDSSSEEGDSKSSENAETEGSSAAVDAVLQTNELLHLIVGEVPLEYRTSIRRVSKAWQATVVKIGHVLQPVAHNRYNQPLYSVSKMLVANGSHPMISCYQKWCTAGFTVYGFEFNPCQLPEDAKITERDSEFLTNPPVTHAKLRFTDQEEGIAILRVHGGIRIGDLRECLERMGSADHVDGGHAYIAVQVREDGESNGSVGTVSSSEEDDPSESEAESDANDSDESDSGAGGAGLPDFGEPGNSDDDGASSDSDDSSEDGDSNSGEHEQVEGSSAAAVLDTNELLHMILSEVPLERRTSLRCVSKNWKTAVEKIGHALNPIDHEHFESARSRPLPLYTSVIAFRPNPALFDERYVLYACRDDAPADRSIECHRLRVNPLTSITELGEKEDHFITDPPLTELRVYIQPTMDEVTLRVNGGIRLKDLLRFFPIDSSGQRSAFTVATFGGPKEAIPSYDSLGESDSSDSGDESEEGSFDESGDVTEDDGPADPSAPDEPDDESGEGSLDEYENEARGDQPEESIAPGGGSEKGDGEATEVEQVGASSKVLLTNELLQMIISEVTREDRTSLRHVSKTWRGAVLKVGYAFEPIDHEYSRRENWDPLPLYTSQTIFRRNPVFLDYTRLMGGGPDPVFPEYRIMFRTLYQHLPCRSFAKLSEEKGQQFITRPPLTEVNARIGYSSAASVRLQVAGGVRLQDVLDHVQTVGGGTHFGLVYMFFGGPRKFVVYAADREVEG
jgi:hypothetical protein